MIIVNYPPPPLNFVVGREVKRVPVFSTLLRVFCNETCDEVVILCEDFWDDKFLNVKKKLQLRLQCQNLSHTDETERTITLLCCQSSASQLGDPAPRTSAHACKLVFREERICSVLNLVRNIGQLPPSPPENDLTLNLSRGDADKRYGSNCK